jgi:hypothetical protein
MSHDLTTLTKSDYANLKIAVKRVVYVSRR